MRAFPVIIGATASGKTALAVETALLLRERGAPGEIISADAFQVYRGMDIGTAKPTPDERRGVPHHLIDIRDPSETFNVDQWLAAAEEAIDDIRRRGGTPVVVGGTHLFIKALLDGLFKGPAPDPALREAIAKLDSRERRAELERVDPAAAGRIHPNDERRTVRALEVYRATGRPISEWQSQWDSTGGRPDALLTGILWPTAEQNQRINARVKQMVEDGLVEEVRRLWSEDRFGAQAREALGYKQLVAHFEGRCGQDEAIEQIKIQTRRFAKNQRTWLRRLLGPNDPKSDLSKENRATPIPPAAPLVIDGPETAPEDGAQVIFSKVFALDSLLTARPADP
ncbi:MAG: tRNA (adenosine(37)-N6)-dimethylallyltransferase MiaA [Phycisphaeraceae bacterium]|nr:MAG: tRNA (adenosine(37)-N6)-dimethylallyltransferase MiaA [Phycisphaeraceae bacterium]